MLAVLKQRVVPNLRSRGFKGSMPHFRRADSNGIDLLTFQFDRHGGGFVVELAVCPADGFTLSWGEHVPASQVTAHHLTKRLRLGAVGKETDHWFRYDRRRWFSRSNAFERCASDVLALLDSQGQTYWANERGKMTG